MECRYCRAQNAEDDHRCRRCGRRLRVTPAYVGQSAAAPELQVDESRQPDQPLRPAVAATVEAVKRTRAVVYQPSLFSSREMPRVVPFESISPVAPERAEPRISSPRRRQRKTIPGQQSLEFLSAAGSSRVAQTDSLPVIYCDAPVAVPAHRIIAAAFDASIIVMATALFMLIFYLSGGEFVLERQTLSVFAGIVVVLALLYKVLWCLGNGDTAGMRWAHLRLVNFDGRRPSREQRLYRMAAGFLSLMAAGLGLLWSLVDEETLTWHDHMSKTFPTPY